MIFLYDFLVPFKETSSTRTQLFKVKNRDQSLLKLFELENTVVTDSSYVLLDKLEIIHPLHQGLFLFQFRLNHIRIHFLLENKLEVVVRESLTVPDEVEVVQ